MNTKDRLILIKEIEHRNQERIDAYQGQRKRPSGKRKGKPMRNKEKGKKRPE